MVGVSFSICAKTFKETFKSAIRDIPSPHWAAGYSSGHRRGAVILHRAAQTTGLTHSGLVKKYCALIE